MSSGLSSDVVHQCLVLLVLIGHSASTASSSARRTIVAPVRTTLTLRAVSGHVPRVTANSTDDVCREISLLRAVVFAMTNLTA
jgi:hypothetical protein